MKWMWPDMSGLPHVLIVDDSRIVRVAMIKHLKGHYEVREEDNGEADWQTLVQDHSIRAVISDIQMPNLNGYELLERLRSSKLRRLQQLPFILVSGEETEDERDKARALGVSDFVTKGAGSAEVLARLDTLLALSNAQNVLDEHREHLVQDPASGLFTRAFLERQATQAISHSARHGVETSVMVMGFDGFDTLSKTLGEHAAEEIGSRFAKMLAGKVRQEDSLGHYGPGQYAVISPGTAVIYCMTFAERVREAVEAARLTVRGEMVSVTVSIGVAGVPVDQVASARELLDLAGRRMQEAMLVGGNRTESGGATPATRPISINHALELIQANRPEPVRPHLAYLGLQLLPLIQMINQELNLAMPMDEVERRLSERGTKTN
jgi:diguanylate cyclase (GGDEF)-like protein